MAGFRATGIFPRYREKPLNSQWVLPAGAGGPPRSAPKDRSIQIPDLIAEAVGIYLKTPFNFKELKDLEKSLKETDPLFAKPIIRLFFCKIIKVFEVLAVKLATIQARNKYLESKLKKEKPKKHRKV